MNKFDFFGCVCELYNDGGKDHTAKRKLTWGERRVLIVMNTRQERRCNNSIRMTFYYHCRNLSSDTIKIEILNHGYIRTWSTN